MSILREVCGELPDRFFRHPFWHRILKLNFAPCRDKGNCAEVVDVREEGVKESKSSEESPNQLAHSEKIGALTIRCRDEDSEQETVLVVTEASELLEPSRSELC